MKISASFLSSSNIPMDLKRLNETDVDYIHVDVMDGKFVPNKTMPFSEMKNIYKFTNKRLDVHLMVEDPKKYIPLYAELNTEFITFHVETMDNIEENLELIKSYGIKCGLAIKPNTPVKNLVPYLPLLDLILVMSVEPGKGGQSFIFESEDKIIEVRNLLILIILKQLLMSMGELIKLQKICVSSVIFLLLVVILFGLMIFKYK